MEKAVHEERNLGVFEKYLTLWVFICIGIGVLIGKVAPGAAKLLDGMSIYVNAAPVVSIPIAICLFFMMYPVMVKIDFAEVIKAGKSPKDKFEVESAGLEPGKLNPTVVEVMKEVGIDISQNKTKSVFDFYKQSKQYRLHWGFPDPSGFQGTWEEKLEKTREVRDKVKRRLSPGAFEKLPK